jgi:hypothetical protein
VLRDLTKPKALIIEILRMEGRSILHFVQTGCSRRFLTPGFFGILSAGVM